MNIPVMLFFIALAAAAAVAIIKVNSGSCKESLKTFTNFAVGICLLISIMFLPFGNKAPDSLYEMAVYALNPDKPEPAKQDEPKEKEFPDIVVYECEDYYIGMDKETHVMEIIPSKKWLEKTKNDKERGYYSFSDKYLLAGQHLNVYAARLSDDPGFVCAVLFEDYYQDEDNKAFYLDDNPFGFYDGDKGYLYGYVYVKESIADLRGYGYRIGDKTIDYDGIYEAIKLDKKYFEDDMQVDMAQPSGGFINILILLFFIIIVVALSAALIKVNSSEDSGNYTVVVNVAVGICLTVAIMFLPFGTDSPKTLFGRAVKVLSPDKPTPTQVAEKPVTASEPEDEISDFVVYECDDYYIGMDKEDHIMKIIPSEERLKDVLATERLGYYSYYKELILAGHNLKVYAARLAGDEGCVVVVLFDEYYSGAVNTGFTESNALFRLHDEEKGYMYGYAYVYDDVNNAWGFSFYIGNNTDNFDGLYEALVLDRKYYEADE